MQKIPISHSKVDFTSSGEGYVTQEPTNQRDWSRKISHQFRNLVTTPTSVNTDMILFIYNTVVDCLHFKGLFKNLCQCPENQQIFHATSSKSIILWFSSFFKKKIK